MSYYPNNRFVRMNTNNNQNIINIENSYIDLVDTYRILSSNILRHMNYIHSTYYNTVNITPSNSDTYLSIATQYLNNTNTILNTIHNMEHGLRFLRSTNINSILNRQPTNNITSSINLRQGVEPHIHNFSNNSNTVPTTTTTTSTSTIPSSSSIPNTPLYTTSNQIPHGFEQISGNETVIPSTSSIPNTPLYTTSNQIPHGFEQIFGNESTIGNQIINTLMTQLAQNTGQNTTTSSLITLFFPLSQNQPSQNIPPSQTIIENSTRNVMFSDIENNENYDRCPIDLIPFEQNDDVLQIRYCNHVFRRNNLMNWFQNHSTCPVCRYNIINYNVNNENNSENNNSENNNNDNNMNSFLDGIIDTAINSFNNTINNNNENYDYAESVSTISDASSVSYQEQ